MLVSVTLYQLICGDKTTSLLSEPARWSYDNCQWMSDFDSCQFIVRKAYITNGLESIFVQDLMWHLTLAYMYRVYGRSALVRYFITKFSRMDSLPNFLTHGAPLPRLMDCWLTVLCWGRQWLCRNRKLCNSRLRYILVPDWSFFCRPISSRTSTVKPLLEALS